MIKPLFDSRPMIITGLIAIISPILFYVIERNFHCTSYISAPCGVLTLAYVYFGVLPAFPVLILITFFICYINYGKKYKLYKKEMEDFLKEEDNVEGKKD